MKQQPLFDLDPYIVEPVHEASTMEAYFGKEAAAKITGELGGQTFRVPTECSGVEYDTLCSALGPELAEQFIQTFGGEMTYIPNDHQAKVNDRNASIRSRVSALIKEGHTRNYAVRTTAKEFGMSDRNIRRILK